MSYTKADAFNDAITPQKDALLASIKTHLESIKTPSHQIELLMNDITSSIRSVDDYLDALDYDEMQEEKADEEFIRSCFEDRREFARSFSGRTFR